MPQCIREALHDALEVATGRVPGVPGKVYVAGLFAAALLRKNPDAETLPFTDDVIEMKRPLDPTDSVMTNAGRLAELLGGGTACGAALRRLNAKKMTGDLVVYVSDNQSWADFARTGGGQATPGTLMAEEWERFRARSPQAKLVLIDIQPYGSTQVGSREDVLNVGGFSDAVFEVVSLFAKGELSSDHFVGAIEAVTL